MNTAEINKALAAKLGKTQKETGLIIESTVAVLNEALIDDESFTIPNLGTFGSKIRAARNAFNPALKRIVQLPPVKALQFHASVGLKHKVKDREL